MPAQEGRKSPDLRDNVEERRFELDVDGEVAFLEYRRYDDRLHLMHTEVPSSLRGRGAGSRLVRAVLDRAREDGVRIVPNCPYVKAFLKRHPEYSALVHSPRSAA